MSASFETRTPDRAAPVQVYDAMIIAAGISGPY